MSRSKHVNAWYYLIEMYSNRLIINYASMLGTFLIFQFNYTKTIPYFMLSNQYEKLFSVYTLKALKGGSISILTLESYHYTLNCDMTQAAWAFHGTCVMYCRPVGG